MGKTGQIVRACQLVKAKSVRVVCPGVGTEHWRREFRKWWEGPMLPALEILSYDDARRMTRGVMKVHDRANVLVADECHFAKNPAAQRTVAIFGKGGLAWYADRIWCASGTPAPNNASELYPMLKAYGATARSFESFKSHFCVVDDMGKVRGTRMDRKDELRVILKPYVLRRLKKDVLPELGEIDIQHWYVKPDARYAVEALHSEEIGAAGRQEAELRRQIKDKSPEDLLAFLAGDQEFATLRRYNALLKAPAVFDQVMFEIDNGLVNKIVVFGYHREALAVLHRKFNEAGVGAVLIYGDTPARERDAQVESWKKPNGPRVNISSVEVAGTVLDYTAAHQVIALEMMWVPGANWQAWQRPHRQGQTQPVTVRVAMGSEIDEIVNDVVLRKTKEIAAIFD